MDDTSRPTNRNDYSKSLPLRFWFQKGDRHVCYEAYCRAPGAKPEPSRVPLYNQLKRDGIELGDITEILCRWAEAHLAVRHLGLSHLADGYRLAVVAERLSNTDVVHMGQSLHDVILELPLRPVTPYILPPTDEVLHVANGRTHMLYSRSDLAKKAF